jgi:hypothetical protein
MLDFLIYLCISFGFLSLGAIVVALFITYEVGEGERDNDE